MEKLTNLSAEEAAKIANSDAALAENLLDIFTNIRHDAAQGRFKRYGAHVHPQNVQVLKDLKYHLELDKDDRYTITWPTLQP